MSVSPISSSMMSVYVPSSGTLKDVAEKDYEYLRILQQLTSMGIVPTGDKTTDRLRLQTILNAQQMQESQKSTSRKDSIPFDDVMNNLNLTVTGDLDKDYDTTINRLDYEIDLASNNDEKQYYQALKYQVESEYNSSKKDSVSYFSGASQVSLMNRYTLGI